MIGILATDSAGRAWSDHLQDSFKTVGELREALGGRFGCEALEERCPCGTGRTPSTRAAAECLLRIWPTEWGPRHKQAREAFIAVLKGEQPRRFARQAFVEAAREAGILVVAFFPADASNEAIARRRNGCSTAVADVDVRSQDHVAVFLMVAAMTWDAKTVGNLASTALSRVFRNLRQIVRNKQPADSGSPAIAQRQTLKSRRYSHNSGMRPAPWTGSSGWGRSASFHRVEFPSRVAVPQGGRPRRTAGTHKREGVRPRRRRCRIAAESPSSPKSRPQADA
ncbi:MAG: DUF982 domain-containing protein [Mesorhizobium sp.]|nr:MAG: DUF982 domain-containing protein [Mesorhizobium sp.]RWP55214.1 MAG: DUF982 domain-containing protein [Mesorhizobium sp.]TIW66281.1 MAG: DUF982 domain-containing protein [Mesorhizobium sp.]